MKWISNRGNTNGPQRDQNVPAHVSLMLEQGHIVCVDAWRADGEFFLGNDSPTYKVDRFFFQNERVWTRCRNTAALLDLSRFPNANCFSYDGQPTVTSRGFAWAPAATTEWNSNTVLFGNQWSRDGSLVLPYAICSDFAAKPEMASRPFDLLIADIDGVMTNGKMYDVNGAVVGKQYCDLDFTAIKRFWAAGIKVCFLSGDMKVNEAMARTRKVRFFHNPPGMDKVDILPEIMMEYDTTRVAYVGDDYYDIQIMSAVPISLCPANAPAAVKRAAKHVIPVEAGMGVLAGIYDIFEHRIHYAFPKDSPDVNPK